MAFIEDIVGADEPQKRVSKEEANYRQAQGDEACASCKFFLPPEACQLVEGLIDPNGVSDLFEPKEPEGQEATGAPQPDPAALASALFGGGPAGGPQQ